MSVLEIMFIVFLAIAILSALGFILFLVLYIFQNQKIKKLPTKRFKNKKRNKQIARKRNQIIKQKRRAKIAVFVTLFCSVVFAGGSAYVSYYQAMNLTNNDSNAVVKGYYLLRDFEEQLILAKEKDEKDEKLQQNIRYLSTAMASYGIEKANTLNSKEGQLVLNRYYIAIKQLGMNASTQTKKFYGNPALVDEFLTDVKKAETYEKAAFDYFKVDATAFSEEK